MLDILMGVAALRASKLTSKEETGSASNVAVVEHRSSPFLLSWMADETRSVPNSLSG